MKVFQRTFLLGVLGLIVLVVTLPLIMMNVFVHQSNFHRFTEEKASELLQAKVRIGDFRVGFLNEVNLSGFEIQGRKESAAYQMEVGAITLRYNWLNLFQPKNRNPAVLILQTPILTLGRGKVPYELFKSLGKGPRIALPALELQKGRIRIPIAKIQREIIAEDVHLQCRTMRGGLIQIEGRGLFQGLLSGNVSILGWVDPDREKYHVQFKLHDVRISKDLPIPFDLVNGDLIATENSITFRKLEVRCYGWRVLATGSLSGLFDAPAIEVSWNMPASDVGQVSLAANLNMGKLESSLRIGTNPPLTLQGLTEFKSEYFKLKEIHIQNRFVGEMVLDYASAVASVHLEEEGKPQRLELQYHLKKLETDLNLKMDHFDVSGLDLVTDMSIHLKPVFLFNDSRLWKLAGDFKSNYCLIEYTPLDDFRGHFELGTSGFQSIMASWGNHFQLKGKGSFQNNQFLGDAIIDIHDFDISQVERFANRPLPKKVGGMMNGSIQLKGRFPDANVFGNLTIKDGCLADLQYDLAMIQIAGVPPMINLKDSKVYRGRTKLDLMGTINLASANMLHDIRYQTPDNLIAYKAFQWESDEGEGDIEVKKRGPNLPSLSIRTGGGTGNSGDETRAKEGHDKYVVVGPKIKF